MIGAQLRPLVGKVTGPLVNRLHAWGVTPDAVTATGTVGVVAAALTFFPGGHFLVGTLVITLFVLTDTIDGALARKRGISSSFGAWLDSSCDRVADGAIFGALLLWYAGTGDDDVLVAVTLIEACAYVVGRLVFEVVRINRQRLDFAKLSIIAKDVSAASARSTALTDGEVFDLETKLKMELLREHMKNYTGAEFEYKGSAIISALIGVADRLSGKKQA